MAYVLRCSLEPSVDDMGKIKRKKLPKSKRHKTPKADRSRKMNGDGSVKKRRGDIKSLQALKTGFKVKQKKGGKWVRTGDRVCKIHTVCDCVKRTDPTKIRQITNR